MPQQMELPTWPNFSSQARKRYAVLFSSYFSEVYSNEDEYYCVLQVLGDE